MKTVTKGLFGIALLFACLTSSAQSPVREPDLNKPLLFQQLPQQLNCRVADLVSLFNLETGELVNVSIADNFPFNGVISSTVSKENGRIVSVVIRSQNFSGAILSFSRITPESGDIYYTGRIISLQHGDGFEIAMQNGNYVLNKKSFYDMINE